MQNSAPHQEQLRSLRATVRSIVIWFGSQAAIGPFERLLTSPFGFPIRRTDIRQLRCHCPTI